MPRQANNEQTAVVEAKKGSAALLELLERYHERIQAVLPRPLPPERINAAVMNAIGVNYKIAGCQRMSVFNAVAACYAMGLEIRKNEAYLVPYGRQCQLIVDYRGKIKVAVNTGTVRFLKPFLVYSLDELEIDNSRYPQEIIHRPFVPRNEQGHIVPPGQSDRGEVVGGYCKTRLVNGAWSPQEMMWLWELEKVRKSSKASADGPWVNWKERMQSKSLVHREFNNLPLNDQLWLSQMVDVAADTGGEIPTVIDVTPQELGGADEPLDEEAPVAQEPMAEAEEEDDMPKRKGQK